MYCKVYTFKRFLALNLTYNIHEVPNLISTFVLMPIVLILSFVDWRHSGGVFHTREYELTFHMYCKVYTFYRFLALNSTHNIHEAPNLISTFVLMSIVIILSFFDWRHGGGVFHTCENDLFTCMAMCKLSTGFWLSILHTTSMKHQT